MIILETGKRPRELVERGTQGVSEALEYLNVGIPNGNLTVTHAGCTKKPKR